MKKNVDHPEHYNHGKYEAIDVIEDWMSDEEIEGFLKGNVLKYLCRAGRKTLSKEEDYEKARWYLDRLIGE